MNRTKSGVKDPQSNFGQGGVRLISSATTPAQSDRITAILPVTLISHVESRVAALREHRKVSVSGYIEAALRELLARGEADLLALERHDIRARRKLSRIKPTP